MRISDYPYGRVYKKLRKAVTWLNRNRRRLEECFAQSNSFDWPLYWGMPKAIAKRLSTDEVDWIQAETAKWNLKGDE